jgi:hypothetical protein
VAIISRIACGIPNLIKKKEKKRKKKKKKNRKRMVKKIGMNYFICIFEVFFIILWHGELFR